MTNEKAIMTKDVTLREMVEAMSAYADDETFRWFTDSSSSVMRVSMGQARKELKIQPAKIDCPACQGCGEREVYPWVDEVCPWCHGSGKASSDKKEITDHEV